MQSVQQQLQELKAEVDSEEDSFEMEEHALTDKIEQLRDEFRELLIEMRRRRAHENANILSDDVSILIAVSLFGLLWGRKKAIKGLTMRGYSCWMYGDKPRKRDPCYFSFPQF
jgi:hypothetical protein